MKKLSLLPFLTLCFFSFQTKAQTPFNTIDSVDINNISAAVLVHGDLWLNPTTQTTNSSFPKNSGKNINYAGSLWMSAYDGAGQLHVTAQTYRMTGNDYWPGPLDINDSLNYQTSQNWARIWKVNRTDIQGFQAITAHTVANTPQPILTWPAKGNTYAQGNAGAALTITTNMAPFIDLNGNGIYEPLLGEYPDVPGDQALWWIFSDNGPTHSETHGNPLGVEVHAMAYAYNRNTLIDNVIYYDYNIVNRSANTYHTCRIGQWDDIDLGYSLDDYIGFDSTRRMGIAYNATNDDGQFAGHPPNSYGIDPPQSAITMIVLPGDAGTSYVPAGSFMYYNNDASIIGNPTNDTEYYYYMHAKIRTGASIGNSFPQPAPCGGFGPNVNYVFPGDPSDSTKWSECTCADYASDRRFVISSADFNLNAGSTTHIVFALVVADSANGCPTNFNKIRIVADTAWNIYYHPLSPLPYTAVTNVATTGSIKIYPNPAHNNLYIENTEQNMNDADITVYNVIGQMITVPITRNGQKYALDISALPYGLYNIRYRNGDKQAAMKFMKQ